MNATTAIAQVLSVSPNSIASVQEFNKVYLVIFNKGIGRRPRFVSKRQVQALMPFTFTLQAGRRGSKPWVARITGLDGGVYGFARQFVEPVAIEWNGKKGCKSADYSLSLPGIYQDSEDGYYRLFRDASGVLSCEGITYDEVKYSLSRNKVLA